MKRATCIPFVNVLHRINQQGITTKAALMADLVLYTHFWLALLEFCHFALLSKTGGKNQEGRILPGNAGKIDLLESRGILDRDEMETDCAIKVVEKLDLVLRQPIEKQKNYCYAICNNLVNDRFRKFPLNAFQAVSLNSALEGEENPLGDARTYEAILGDDQFNPERLHCEEETVLELRERLREKRAKEQAEQRQRLLLEVEQLAQRPAEVFARLGMVYLGRKPRELARRIVQQGCKRTYEEVLLQTARENRVALADLYRLMGEGEMTAQSVKAHTDCAESVATQISRLAYRADKRLRR